MAKINKGAMIKNQIVFDFFKELESKPIQPRELSDKTMKKETQRKAIKKNRGKRKIRLIRS